MSVSNSPLPPLYLVAVLLLSVGVSQHTHAQTRFGPVADLTFSLDRVQTHLIASEDSIASDTLFEVQHPSGEPVVYFRKLRTSVCFDNKCRLLKVTLYWKPTGHYGGFELPSGEYLSKSEHKPFTGTEYRRLDTLLADAYSPLGQLAYAELAPTPRVSGGDYAVDGVSSATAKNVLNYVVEGAAYTTYKMWHVVYGPTQEAVSSLTSRQLTPALLMRLLTGPVNADKIWVLTQITLNRKLITPEVEQQLLLLANGSVYTLAERAVFALDPAHTAWQPQLMALSLNASHALKKIMLTKLKQAERLDLSVVRSLATRLPDFGGDLMATVVDVFRQHRITELQAVRAVGNLLAYPNRFVSEKAYGFLSQLSIPDETVKQQLMDYKNLKQP